ncbi:uncharacterized protein LOC131874297 [Cryptomeria japonica]|uniref:uncharacterized protein LOC131874297 n=1 Tax=Cryptomeria japonica TaxID=3369 RepID=UPI0027DA19AB|nr:uncharacterized protein LOC131874297 [Cryptomeria japonica]
MAYLERKEQEDFQGDIIVTGHAGGKDQNYNRRSNEWKENNSKGNSGESGIGTIIQDEQGNILHGLFGAIGVATNNEAKICALEAGLHLCVRQGISRIIIEEHLKKIESYEIGYVYREGNQVADYFANLGVGEYDDPVYFCQTSTAEDIKGQCLKDCQTYPRQGIE